MDRITAVVLAAGKGTRMRSAIPKVLHPLAGKPLIMYAIQMAGAVSTEMPVVVVGHEADAVRETVGSAARFVLQEEQLGTGHAVRVTEALIKNESDYVVVCYGDMPLLTSATLQALIDQQRDNPGPISMLTMSLADSHGFGRVIRKPDGSVLKIVEEAQATSEQLAVKELNVGVYCFSSSWLWNALTRVPLSPKGEYYLTDVVGIASGDGLQVRAITMQDSDEAIGINTRVHLAEAEKIMRRRINAAWMEAGVTMIDPDTTYIEPDVRVGVDTVILPNTMIRGKTQVGENCVIGPGSLLENCVVGARSRVVNACLFSGVVLEPDSEVGPYIHLSAEEPAAG